MKHSAIFATLSFRMFREDTCLTLICKDFCDLRILLTFSVFKLFKFFLLRSKFDAIVMQERWLITNSCFHGGYIWFS